MKTTVYSLKYVIRYCELDQYWFCVKDLKCPLMYTDGGLYAKVSKILAEDKKKIDNMIYINQRGALRIVNERRSKHRDVNEFRHWFHKRFFSMISEPIDPRKIMQVRNWMYEKFYCHSTSTARSNLINFLHILPTEIHAINPLAP